MTATTPATNASDAPTAEKSGKDAIKPVAKRSFDWKSFIPGIVMGQTRKRLPQNTMQEKLMAAVIGGVGQAIVAALLDAPSALEKRSEELALSAIKRRHGIVFALVHTSVRNAIGFIAFFLMYDAAKSKQKTSPPAVAIARNVVASVLAAIAYRLATWAVDGRLPADLDSVVGKSGGSPYSGALKRVYGSASKAIISMAVMEAVLGKSSW